MKTIEITGIEFPTAGEAIQHTFAAGRGEAITVGGRCFVVEKPEAERLATAGVAFAYLHVIDHPDHPHGLVVAVPVN